MKKSSRQILELTVYALILVVGLLLVYIGSLLVEEGFLKSFYNSAGGAFAGIGLTGLVTTFFDFGALNEIKSLIEQLPAIRISSIKISEKERLNSDFSKKNFYRYFKSWDGTKGRWIWRAKHVRFSLSDDKRRVIADLQYKYADITYSYEIEGSYIKTHFVLVMEERNGRDEPTVEVYAFSGRLREALYPGLSFRQSWPPNERKLNAPCILSLKWIEGLGESPGNDSVWETDDVGQIKILEKKWATSFSGVYFDDFCSTMSEHCN